MTYRDSRFYLQMHSLFLKMEPPHQQVLPYFPQYDTRQSPPGICLDYSNPENVVGHQQRAFVVYWALRAFVESGGCPGIDGGGAGVFSPGCINVDLYGNTEKNAYESTHDAGVHIRADCTQLDDFQTDSFSCFLASHVVEHFPCATLPAVTPWPERAHKKCPGSELIEGLRKNFIRIVRPTGYICLIIPDEEKSLKLWGVSTLELDKTHQHAWTADTFFHNILVPLTDEVDILEYDTFDNNFSINCVLRKKER
jgi:predicted SAM-dependent methyltransferase